MEDLGNTRRRSRQAIQ